MENLLHPLGLLHLQELRHCPLPGNAEYPCGCVGWRFGFSFLSGILHGMARFLALYQGEYSRERLVLRLRTVHPKTITRLAQNGTGNVADRHMKQILSIYNGAGRAHSLPCKR